MVKVAVAGATGYAGGEILRLLSSRSDVEIGALTGSSSVGSLLGQHQPHLFALRERVIQETAVETLVDHDVVFLALPHGQSAALAARLPNSVFVIDCGADFRLENAEDWARFYDTPYAGRWAYGLPELAWNGSKHRHELSGARRIAVPGCYPTAVSLALAPLFAADLVLADDVVVVAASGTSGAGKSLKPHLLGSESMGSMSPYGVGGVHRHTPEIVQNLRGAWPAATKHDDLTVSFTPTLAPMPRGILATCTAKLNTARATSLSEVRAALDAVYGDEPFIQVLPDGAWPSTGSVLGSNMVALNAAVDEACSRIIVVAAIDNLTKGTAGAAVQCMNLALGIDETYGLPRQGVAP